MEIFCNSAKAGVKRMDEEKNVPRKRLRRILDRGRRASALGGIDPALGGSSDRSAGKTASLLFSPPGREASVDDLRVIIAVSDLLRRTDDRKTREETWDCSNTEDLRDAGRGIEGYNCLKEKEILGLRILYLS